MTDALKSVLLQSMRLNGDVIKGEQMPSQETTNAVTERDIKALHEEVEELKTAIKGLVDERDKALKWGIVTIGAAFIGVCTWIVNFFTSGHFK